ncbi:MAG: alkaline phosphatase D family protein [Caulobacterales bacterium]|nr:alkaline phosphatase D family protein [Caulobacterales bacterium]
MTDAIISRRQALRGGLALAGGAAAASCASNVELADATAASFGHGVASGDPHADSVVIWTRITPEDDSVAKAAARWQIARDRDFDDIVAEGAAPTDAARDFTVKAVVTGLEPGSVYFYRFLAGEAVSPAGRTKTLPVGALDTLVIAACSCSNYPFGYFHAYRHMGGRDDLDAILHLGDYIYEYGADGYGEEPGKRLGRVSEPPHETVSLADYRTRHAQYRSDPDLQAASAAAPWIPSWDDHEITNNPWTDGAQNHQKSEGPWEDRKAAALRAYFEWMPVRDPAPGEARETFWRSFEFGDLATLVMFETRLSGRSKQLDVPDDVPLIETPFDMSDPDAPVAVTDEAVLAGLDPSDIRYAPTPFDITGERPVPILDYDRIQAIDPDEPPEGVAFLPAKDKFLAEVLGDEARTMIPPAQEAFAVDTVAASAARGTPWQVLGSQIIFARQLAPNMDAAWDEATKAKLLERTPWLGSWIRDSTLGLPSNMDAWDGYPVQRDRLADAFSDADANVVVLTGDTHTWWANQLHDTRQTRIGAEFGVTAVTSPSYVGYFEGAEPSVTSLIEEANRDVVYVDGSARGYLTLTLTPEAARCDFIAVSDIEAKDFTARVLKSWRLKRRDEAGVPELEDVTQA